MNTHIQIKPPSVLIQIKEKDNAILVSGQGPEQHHDKVFMKDSETTPQDVQDLVQTMAEFQRAGLVEFAGEQSPAVQRFDAELERFNGDVSAMFKE